MDLALPLRRPINLATALRQAGYHPIHDYATKQDSWVRTLGRLHYPRFHLYPTASAIAVQLSLHIDQKQNTTRFCKGPRHAGEYDSPIVQVELVRLQRWLDYSQSA